MTETTTITSSQTFQERMYERVKESIGELLTKEEAKQLVDKAIQDALFTPKKITNYYGSVVGEEKSEFVKLVKEAVEPIIKNSIDNWIVEHQDQVNEIIEKVIQDGILSACYKAFQQQMRDPMYNLQSQLIEVVNKIGGV